MLCSGACTHGVYVALGVTGGTVHGGCAQATCKYSAVFRSAWASSDFASPPGVLGPIPCGYGGSAVWCAEWKQRGLSSPDGAGTELQSTLGSVLEWVWRDSFSCSVARVLAWQHKSQPWIGPQNLKKNFFHFSRLWNPGALEGPLHCTRLPVRLLPGLRFYSSRNVVLRLSHSSVLCRWLP